MKTILLACILFISSVCFSQNIQIHSSGLTNIVGFKRFTTPTGKEDFYIQHYQFQSVGGGIWYIMSLQNNSMVYGRHNGFLNTGSVFCPLNFQSLPIYVTHFTRSLNDTNLLIRATDTECEPDLRISITKNNGMNNALIFHSGIAGRGGISEIDPVNDSTMFILFDNFPNERALRKTTNRGTSWFAVDTLPTPFIQHLKINPFNRETIFAAYNSLFLRSTNGGLNFDTLVFPGGNIHSIDFNTPSLRIYITSPSGIFYSTNNGNSWTQIFNIGTNSFKIDPDNPAIFYAGTPSGIYRSTNSGSSWNLYNDAFLPSKNVIGISKSVGSGDTLFAVTTKGVYKVFKSIIANSSGLSYLPLKVGNSWTFKVRLLPAPDWYEKFTILDDSVRNGHTYYLFNKFINGQGWYRVDSITSCLYKLKEGCNEEVLIDSLNAPLNKTIIPNCFPLDSARCTDTLTFVFIGDTVESKTFTGHFGVMENERTYAVTYGLAALYTNEVDPISYELQGCAINGIVYGDTAIFPHFSVSGVVRFEDNLQRVTSGKVSILRLDKNTGRVILVDSTTISSEGSYFVPNVVPETSYVMAYQDDEEDFVPTFYPSSIDWMQAVRIYPNQPLTNVNINVKRITISENNSSVSVSGYIHKAPPNGFPLNYGFVYAKIGNNYASAGYSGLTGQYTIPNAPTNQWISLYVNRIGFAADTLVTYLSPSGNYTNVNFYLDQVYVGITQLSQEFPSEYQLSQNYPNPFNPQTNITFDIPKSSFVKLEVYDVSGRLVKTLVNKQMSAGSYKVDFNASSLPSGVYFYKMKAGEFIETKRMVLIK